MSKKEKRKYTYATSYTYNQPDGKEVKMYSQLYQIGIYCCVECTGEDRLQMNLTPGIMFRVQKRLQEDTKISNFTLGHSITVIEDENGFWKELELNEV